MRKTEINRKNNALKNAFEHEGHLILGSFGYQVYSEIVISHELKVILKTFICI